MQRDRADIDDVEAAVPRTDPAAVESACALAAARLEDDPSLTGISAALVELWQSSGRAVLGAAFSLEGGCLWAVAQAGYRSVPDGLPLARGVIGAAASGGKPLFVPDVGASPDYVAARPGIRSELAVPVLDDGEVVGILNFESPVVLTGAAVAALTSLSEACGRTLAAASRGQNPDMAAIAHTLVQATTLHDVAGMAELAARTLGRLYGADAAQVNLLPDYELAGSWSAGRARPLPPQRVRAIASSSVPGDRLSVVDERGRSLVCLPLRAGGLDHGVAVVSCARLSSVDFERAELALLVAAHTAASIGTALALERAELAATTDLLTGVLNRRGFARDFEREVGRSRRTGAPLTLALFDCDDFKRVNDSAGHAAGDELLRRIGQYLERDTRKWDLVARLGGDEFAVAFPETVREEAALIVRRLQRGIAKTCAGAGYTLTACCGLAAFGEDGDAVEELLRQADRELYAAKGEPGRDHGLLTGPVSLAGASEARRRG